MLARAVWMRREHGGMSVYSPDAVIEVRCYPLANYVACFVSFNESLVVVDICDI